jgi:hypothetical protein
MSRVEPAFVTPRWREAGVRWGLAPEARPKTQLYRFSGHGNLSRRLLFGFWPGYLVAAR